MLSSRSRALHLGTLAALLLSACAAPVGRIASPHAGTAVLTVRGDRFFLDGRPFDMWGIRVASASQNERLTTGLIENLDEYRTHGVNSLAVFYMGSRGANSDPFSPDGLTVDADHQRRMERIIRAAAERGMVVVAGIFYQHAPLGLRDAAAVANVVRTVTAALRPYRNVIVNIANEQNSPGWEDSGLWLQLEPIRYDLGGSGQPGNPGMRWYFEAVRERVGAATARRRGSATRRSFAKRLTR